MTWRCRLRPPSAAAAARKPLELPFFSSVSLGHSNELLGTLELSVALTRIPVRERATGPRSLPRSAPAEVTMKARGLRRCLRDLVASPDVPTLRRPTRARRSRIYGLPR